MFLTFFFVEMVLKIYGLGFHVYFNSSFNCFDCAVSDFFSSCFFGISCYSVNKEQSLSLLVALNRLYVLDFWTLYLIHLKMLNLALVYSDVFVFLESSKSRGRFMAGRRITCVTCHVLVTLVTVLINFLCW